MLAVAARGNAGSLSAAGVNCAFAAPLEVVRADLVEVARMAEVVALEKASARTERTRSILLSGVASGVPAALPTQLTSLPDEYFSGRVHQRHAIAV